MSGRIVMGCLVLAGLGSTSAVAQNNVGDVVDAGGKKLTKEQFVAAFVGANVSGPTQGGGQMQVDYKADGTFAGNLHTAQGKNATRFGTWTVDDKGMVCVDITTSAGGGRQDKSCGFIFQVADQYFYAIESDERTARVLLRTVKK